MGVRNIVNIDEDKCTGCGLCIIKCAEGALQIIDGKARLVKEIYCDGLGACLGECPEGAISIIERDADAFNIEATEEHLEKLHGKEEKKEAHYEAPKFMCPSSQSMSFAKNDSDDLVRGNLKVPSTLTTWPVKIQLIAPQAPYLQNADLLIAADCAPFAYGNFHNDFMKGKVVLIGCPKLNDSEQYFQKILSILKLNNIKSVTIAHMEVPCCFGLVNLVNKAILASGKNIEKHEVEVGIKGNITKK